MIGVSYTIIGFILVTCLLLQGLYNVCLHPLRKIPGPAAYRFSSFPRHFAVIRGKHVRVLAALHETYGPVVRFGPNEISFITAQAWKDIYGHGRADTFIKDTSFFGVRPHDIEVIVTLKNPNEHARIRRAFNPAFSERAAREQEVVLQKYADRMVWRIGEDKKNNKRATSRVNLVDMFTFAAFDAIADLCFGQSLRLLDEGKYHPWVKIIFDSAKFAAWSGVLQTILGHPLDKWFAALLLAPFKEKAYAHFKFAADMVDERLKQTNTDRPDIWSFVTRERDASEDTLSLKEMHANAGVIIIGGSETSALCLSALSFFIMHHRDVYKKLSQEIRQAFHASSEICFGELTKLPYLNACLSEALRMLPPGPAGSPRFVPRGGEFVDGYFLPGGTTVYVSPYAAYHHPSNFQDPDLFCPDRWLSKDARFANDRKDVFQPFSIGPRNCIGKNLAWHEMRLLMAKILWHYDMELSTPSTNFLDMKVYLAWEKAPLIATVTEVSR